MNPEKINLKDLPEKILKGAQQAYRKLVRETAARDGELVIGEDDGSFKWVPAKELLKDIERGEK
jgi:hypothetical protein